MGIRVSTGGGIRQRLILRSGQGTLERSGVAADVISWGKRGSGILVATATGERRYGVTIGFVEIADSPTIGVELGEGLGASVEVGDSSTMAVEVGGGLEASVEVEERRAVSVT